MPTLLRNYLIGLLVLLAFPLAGQPGSVTGLSIRAYDHHVELNWDRHPDPSVQAVRVYRQMDGGAFVNVGTENNVTTRHINFLGDWDVTASYYLRPVGSGGQLGAPSDTVTATTFMMSDSALLDMVQEYTLRYFYEFGHPVSGLARERNTTSTVTSGGSGFGIMALIVGAERGFITYEEARERTTKIVDFLLTVPRFNGAFSHWMNGATGAVIPFSPRDDGGDLVETAFLIQGLLTARQYYTGDSPEEIALRDNITQIWEEVNWNWYRKQTGNVLYWHWSPNNGFAINLPLRGFNEVHIAYLLAIAAPRPAFDVPASLYHTGWAGGNYTTSLSYYGIPLLVGNNKGGPLFFSHYSYLGFDPRGIKDRYVNYFVRNTNHSLINYEHCVDNPYNRVGYGPEVWGITASDDPDGYLAHSPESPTLDNGTIAPTAALSSMPYTPVQSMAALKHFYRELGDKTWGPYGFYDAFNQGRNWYATSYLAIDQGPIICMIENHRSGLLWDLFMRNPEIAPALEAIGFEPDSSTVATAELPSFLGAAPRVFPNPAQESITLELALKQSTKITIRLIDLHGREVERLLAPTAFAAGSLSLPLHLRQRPISGYYLLKIESPGGTATLPLLVTD
ncbi:glucoamylase family protein [Neolewinella lacunae]|uniref:T9SS type A sorting domain-containing protein n=1 Tax=Neolewinella lacunae TaxID=1517758 RepID=A0A923T7Y3_9BACT|nr:glucoamylase family protein [Neolewinella lacunae]MBC6995020.1 T9SS type A sorting domain-containing protein [Neolewinella lacunae]MDN3633209.1 glucoamylase family protein [Neolewinella lacunae]